ncbi:hypothetical protein K488DRAFT_84887 [Vararia minispora EC-137]|uniref:Uncharacterized protein n=1 Tax=Vararia minispora EC-137 TaxID=1314806 RepID=A0ACB8QP26_9AGAM|nr:hypothetical protein K488DRAFT_84887 [Vararia minispora EC-137]
MLSLPNELWLDIVDIAAPVIPFFTNIETPTEIDPLHPNIFSVSAADIITNTRTLSALRLVNRQLQKLFPPQCREYLVVTSQTAHRIRHALEWGGREFLWARHLVLVLNKNEQSITSFADFAAIAERLPSVQIVSFATDDSYAGDVLMQPHLDGTLLCTALLNIAPRVRRLAFMEGSRVFFSDVQIGALVRACTSLRTASVSPHFLGPPLARPGWLPNAYPPRFPEIVIRAVHPCGPPTHLALAVASYPSAQLDSLLAHLSCSTPTLAHVSLSAPCTALAALLARHVPPSATRLMLHVAPPTLDDVWAVLIAVLDVGYRVTCEHLQSVQFTQALVARRVRDTVGTAPRLTGAMMAGVPFDILDDTGEKIA